MAKNLKKEDLKGLPSNFHYYYFDNEHRDCHSLDFHSNIKDEFQGYYNLNHIFDKIVKALCFIYNRKKDTEENFDKELCSYLYYWLGDKIYANISDTKVFKKIINTIYHEINSTDLPWICNPLYEEIDQETFKNNKLLFDYSKDRENIRLSTVNALTTCDEHYKKVIEKYKDVYIDAYSNCNIYGRKKYDCSKFSEILRNEPNKELPSFYCKDYKPQTIYLGVTEKGGNPEYPLPEDRREEMNPGPVSHRGTHRLGSPDHDNTHFRSRAAWDKETLNSDVSIPPNDTAEGGTTKTIMGSVAPVLGVSSFSILLYKVTPVGGYINRLLGRNRNMYNNIEYMDTFNPYSDAMVPGDRRMNISYHRL
ncbi:VIR protein [Plasmodium vivax]|uniref:VIR protein n=1 Tax=Plasmodium vivax TaxID=5855 RepID=A0A1G4ECE7_PLAVI|nr:VIR protein [Plasmodium vivax]